MSVLGNGLYNANQYEDALTVREARLSSMRRLGAPEGEILGTKGNLAGTYGILGREEEALGLNREVYYGFLKLSGKEHEQTLTAALNLADSLRIMQRFKEAKTLLRKTTPVARRVLGESNDLTLKLRNIYALALCNDGDATLNDLREAATTLEDAVRTARRLLGSAHPTTRMTEENLRHARAALRARKTLRPGNA